MEKEKVNALCLLSGGIDSFVAVHLLRNIFSINCVHINYGSLADKMESYASHKIAKFFGLDIKEIKLNNYSTHFNNSLTNKNELIKDFFPGRNLLFLSIVASIAQEMEIHNIIIGIIGSSRIFTDCLIPFFRDFENFYKNHYSYDIVIHLPVIEFTKKDIFEYCMKYELPYDITYSCQKGYEIPCGICPSCMDRIEAQKELMK